MKAVSLFLLLVLFQFTAKSATWQANRDNFEMSVFFNGLSAITGMGFMFISLYRRRNP